ncbi:DUF1554 domain-containing protein [Leptospira sp. WS58.C1]|uniref:DUF1554 domain-containing protein n=1 Tax=Leptospira TaxID=171 RepID=UPI0002BFD1ED|nr:MULTISPECIES: DUF1554 domain-containing protein [unclassified Leptospira]EMJ99882.1 PF07588 family protein [Leptospira sp. B5-022]MCR1793939.1 DUF1554 domain-containing protein [Leptospira sp. id769339]
MRYAHSLPFLFLILSFTSTYCNKADSIDLDSSKSPITGAIMIDPTLLVGIGATPIPLQLVNSPGTAAPNTVTERSTSSNTVILELVNPLSPDTGETITFSFNTNDPSSIEISSIAGSNDNSYTFNPSLQAYQAVISLYLDDADCVEQKYSIIAVDSITNVPQTISFDTKDLDKCAFVATNDGKGWQGNFALDSKLDDDARGFADAACNSSSNKPGNFPSTMIYKALLSVTGPSNGSKTRGIQYNDWPFAANTSYYFGSQNKKMFTTDSGRTYNFNPELSQALGSGLLWTGLLNTWSDATSKILSECAGTNQAGGLVSWSSNSVSISAIVGNLAATDSNLISKQTALGLPDYNACNKFRYFLCIGQ